MKSEALKSKKTANPLMMMIKEAQKIPQYER
jgi:hypothetical protein